MSDNKQKQKKDLETSNSNLGSLLCFGSINLLLTLHLTNEDLEQNEINFDKIENLDDITFLKEESSLWDRIELSSPNPTLKMFLYTNKTSPAKAEIKYLCFRKMNFQEKQKEFTDMLSYVLNKSKLNLTSHKVCKCVLSIQLCIYFRTKRKVLVLCGDRIPIDDDDNDNPPREADNELIEEGATPLEDEPEDEKESESEEDGQKKEKKNKLINIPLEIVNPNEHEYIYFKYSDYANEEKSDFNGKISLDDLLEYFVYLKSVMSNIKIILNLSNEDNDNTKSEIFKKILAVTDINIFYSKNKLYEILKYLKYIEDRNAQMEEYYKHLIECKAKQIRKKILKEELPRSESERKYKEEIKEEIKKIYNNKEMPDLLEPKVLDKLKMFHYYQTDIINNNSLKANNCKDLIVVDDFCKIYFVECYKEQQSPIILDFDMKLYPQINIYKLSVVKKYKDFIKERFDEYILILIACLLSSLLHKNGQDDGSNLFVGYLSAVNIIKKILEVEINEIQMPKETDFYYPHLNQNEVKKLLIQIEQKKKESKFILDCNNANQIKMKTYNPILDKNLFYYFNYDKQIYLRNNGFINKKGNVLYDPVYKDNFNNRSLSKKDDRNHKIFGKTVYEMNIMKKYNDSNKKKMKTLYGNFDSNDKNKDNSNRFNYSKKDSKNLSKDSKYKKSNRFSIRRYKLK